MRIYLDEIASVNALTIPEAVCVAQYGADCEINNAFICKGRPCSTMQGMIEQINSGEKGLIMFNGHGGSTTWTFDPLMSTQIAGDLKNINEPNVVIPMACYTTYYHHPGVMSLAEQFLFNPEGGPLVISGPATLSNLIYNGVFARSILEKMCDGTTTLAEAVFETKQENPGLTDQVINWDTIGNGFVTIVACE